MDYIARLDFDTLDLMSEQQPQKLVDNYSALLHSNSETIALKVKCYFAKALVSLSRFAEAEAMVIKMLQEAALNDDCFALVWGNIILSKAYKKSGDLSKAKACLELAEDFALKSGSVDLIVEAQSHFGLFCSEQANIKIALDYMKRVEALVKKTQSGLPAINALLRCSSLYHKLQDHARVVVLLKSALQLALETEIISLQLSIINNLSSTYSQMKRYQDSEALLHKGYKLAHQHHLTGSQLKILFNLGVQCNYQSKFTKAIEYYDQCQAMAVSTGLTNPDFWLDLYINYASCCWMSQDIAGSMDYLLKAELLLADSARPEKQMWIAVNKTNILIVQGKYREAKVILQSAISYYNKEKDLPNLLVAYRNLALLYQKSDQTAQSIAIWQTIDKTHIKHLEQTLISKSEGYQIRFNELQLTVPIALSEPSLSTRSICPDEPLHFIGTSTAIKKVTRTALLASQHNDANVMITGESGTGKEVIARYIHQNSIRKNNSFVAVNCSAISHNLLESEMFGHLKGAFTGALDTTKGFFVAADRGTLFLDEITEMDIEMQPKLLRAMESKTVTPVGGNREIPFDCRIISATNRNVIDLLSADALRLDIFHRLNTIQIHIPPLRERTDDLPLLLDYFIDQYCHANRLAAPRVPKAFLDKLSTYSFPGNVRELKNIVNRMFILYPNLEWDAAFLENADIIHPHQPRTTKRLDISQDDECQLIIQALLQNNGSQKLAARQLGMTESTLSRRIHKYHLQGYTRRP